MTPEERAERIAALQAKRASSLHAGKPMTGYKERVVALDAEIARLEAPEPEEPEEPEEDDG